MELNEANTNAPTVFTWTPGIRPVKTPHKTPETQAVMISKILPPYNNMMYNINIIIY
jgi:hypothetical protein